MFEKFTGKDKRTNLEKEIDDVIDEMANYNSNSEEYTTMSENLERLYKAKSYEKDKRVSPDTMAIVVGNLIGIGIIVWHERCDIITSKALGFVLKGRV